MSTELLQRQEKAPAHEPTESPSTHRAFAPRTDIYEAQEKILLWVDMPGVKQEDIEITLEQNVLSVHGRVEAPAFPGHELSYSEQQIGDYRRVFTLSNEIERNGIEASVKNGVLKLTLPKSKAALPRKIEVKTDR
jgi:HSP20 family molecular chaperone IbpA